MSKPLDPILIATIQQAAEDKVANNEMFTAFDVSRVVQNLGHRERHNNMKHVVHELFESNRLPGYDRTLVSVESGKPDAWVYHPVGSDPTQYQPVFQSLPSAMTPQSFYQQGATGSGTPTPAPSSLSSIQFSPTPSRKYQPDKRGAITVPAKLIKQIGATVGDELAVEKNGSNLVISVNGAGRKYKVNTSLNIRIKRKIWGEIAAATQGDFSFEEKAGKIIVSHG